MALKNVGVSYDDFPYPNLTFSLTHPDRLATVGTLFGLSPAPVEHCRYLDIGCAVGGNLFPMAYLLPDSQFVGIDYSSTQIATGRESLKSLGLKNVRLEHLDIMDVPADFGEFDYIIAHGIYSWIPTDVRDRLLEVIHRHLAPHGIAYISYNVYPGWHMVKAIRHMMQYRTRDIPKPMDRVFIARDFLDFLVEANTQQNDAYIAFLESYQKSLGEKLEQGEDTGLSLLLHDELAEINDPVYFHEFVEHATRFDLTYLSEVELSRVVPSRLPKPSVGKLAGMASNQIELEQYLDFINNRMFRQSIVCRSDAPARRGLRPELVTQFKLAMPAKPVADEPELREQSVEHFRATDGATFSTDHPLTKAAFVWLSKVYPRMMPFNDLVQKATEMIALEEDVDFQEHVLTFAANIMRAYTYSEGLIQLHLYEPPFALRPVELPYVSPVARWQAGRSKRVTNLKHDRVLLDSFARYILVQMNGKTSREDLLKRIINLHNEGTLILTKGDLQIDDQDELLKLAVSEMDQNLDFLIRASLIVDPEWLNSN